MYKIMIVDDEKTIREGIARGNPWEEWGFEVAAVCKNGLEAVAQTKVSPPDVILSDIRMPGMDGVELMTYMREHYPQIKLIILSGYKDFEYLNMSIRNQVKEYLLKPTDPDEFEQLFRRLRAELDEQKEKEAAYSRYQTEKNLALLFKEDSEAADRRLAYQELQQSQRISMINGRIVICRLDYRYRYEREEFYSLRKTVTRLCNTIPAKLQRYFWIYKEQFLTGILSNYGEETTPALAEAFLGEVQAAAAQQLKISISFGVSSQCRSAETMRACFAEARHCVGQRVFMGPGTIFFL